MSRLIDRGQVQELAAKRAQLVEVLPAEEYAEDHLPGAINLPLRHVDPEHVAGLDPERAVIVYCWDSA